MEPLLGGSVIRHESRGTEGMVPEDSITGERASQTAVMGTPSRDQQCAAAAGPCVGGPRDEVWACQGSLGWKETRQSARLSGSALDTRTGLCLHHQAQHQGRKAGPDRATLGDVYRQGNTWRCCSPLPRLPAGSSVSGIRTHSSHLLHLGRHGLVPSFGAAGGVTL